VLQAIKNQKTVAPHLPLAPSENLIHLPKVSSPEFRVFQNSSFDATVDEFRKLSLSAEILLLGFCTEIGAWMLQYLDALFRAGRR
jgi:hypothetical protein